MMQNFHMAALDRFRLHTPEMRFLVIVAGMRGRVKWAPSRVSRCALLWSRCDADPKRSFAKNEKQALGADLSATRAWGLFGG